ncbi:Histone deacetylase family protein [Candidatus Zixiibacteriota bacterium]|nr:Histone deacetylase family protein [candidate division Zixibacteria bacterium]
MQIGLAELVQEKKHAAPAGHPENAHRVSFALDHVRKSDLGSKLVFWRPTGTDPSSIIDRVHDPKYISFLRQIAANGGGYLDGDTYVTSGSFEAAWETAAAAAEGVGEIISGKIKRIMLAGRPPGHHAEHQRGMGFCLINNTAVAAEAAVVNYHLERVAVIDWDVHHGNGTQHMFYDRPDVFYISLHRFPFYPGSGATSERGSGKGEGYTLNIPLPQGTGGDAYMYAFTEIISPALKKYEPQIIIITAGFDAHRDDPLGGMNLGGETFGEMTKILVGLAEKYCDGKIFSLFEGGYSPSGNAESLYFHLMELSRK